MHSSEELTELLAFQAVEPFGDEWRGWGQLTSTLVNIHCKETITTDECMPRLAKGPERSTKPINWGNVINWFTVGKKKQKPNSK